MGSGKLKGTVGSARKSPAPPLRAGLFSNLAKH